MNIDINEYQDPYIIFTINAWNLVGKCDVKLGPGSWVQHAQTHVTSYCPKHMHRATIDTDT